MSSILTNNGAMVALQTMKSINKDLGGVQNMISTGKKVSDSKDNAAVWAISTVMKSDVSSFKAVGDSLALGQSTVAVARNASEQVTDLLQEMKTKIVSAQQENVDRSKIQADISALRDQVKSVVGAAQFNGLSLLKGTDDVNVLSSLDRSSNGSVSTSSISVSRNNLDSTNATGGTTLLQPTNAGATVTASLNVDGGNTAATGNTRTLGTFTNVNSTLTFATSQALDEGDSTAYTLTSGSDTLTFTYVQTAGSTATTTGEELAKQISNAYAAFKADADIGSGSSVGDYNATTGVYTAAEGTLTLTTTNNADALRHLTMSEASGSITVTNNRDIALTLTGGTVTNRADANIPAVALATTADGATRTVNLSTGTVGMQADDSYTFTLTDNGAGAAASNLAITVTGSTLTEDELADAIFESLGKFKAGTEVGGGTDTYTAAGGTANISFTFTAGTAGNNEAAFKALIDNSTPGDNLTFVQNASGQFQVQNNSGVTFSTQGALTVGSTSTTGAITPTTSTAIAAGTKGDYATIDVGGTKQAGDKLSVTIAGVTNPITYTVTGAETDVDEIATNFMNAINTALTAASITDVVASKDGSNADQIEIKNFNTSATKVVSDVSSVNELSLVTNASGSTIAAGATGTVTMTGRDVAEGDTYSVTVGSDTVSYTAGKNDDLNEVGTSLSGLLKVKTGNDITVSLAAGDDPESDNVVLSVTNNGSSSLALSTTAKSGGTAGGGLELLDDIDVSDTSKASGSLDIVNNLIQTAIDASADFGSSEKRLEIQQSFIGKLTDSMQAGIGTLVDANMEETAARLQALQVQQQLGTQALSIANQAPQNILALFR